MSREPHNSPHSSLSKFFGCSGDTRTIWLVAIGVLVLTFLPYLYGYSLQGTRAEYGFYSWVTFNTSDAGVYLSWMQQASDGNFFIRNLFTTEPQTNRLFNLFFLVLGKIAVLTGLSTIAVFQITRFVVGLCFLRSLWWLIGLLLDDRWSRLYAFLVVCFSAGLGWVPFLWDRGTKGPVDVWQPEAVTFLSIYLHPLFTVSLLLMVGVLGWLIRAERTGRMKYALWAGLCGMLLGNIHTYDVITVAAVWAGYLVVHSLSQRQLNPDSWKRAMVAGALASVSTGYMAWLVTADGALAKRAAIQTESPSLMMYLLGFGIVLLLAVIGASRPCRTLFTQCSSKGDFDSRQFLIVWSLANVAVAYLPVAFQRKLLMGAHISLSILAGAALSYIIVNLVPARARRVSLIYIVALLSITNFRFLVMNVHHLPTTRGPYEGMVRQYLYRGEVAALDWVHANTPPGTVIQPLPWVTLDRRTGTYDYFDHTLAGFMPGLTGKPVHAGHWAETADFGTKMERWSDFLHPEKSEEWRRELLRSTGVKYLIFSQKNEASKDPYTNAVVLKPFLSRDHPFLRIVPEASNGDATVYEVVLPEQQVELNKPTKGTS